MGHRVIAYSGCSYANEPREFYSGERHHLVKRVRATWVEQTEGLEGLTRQVWRVTDEDGGSWRLTYYWTGDFWEVAPEAGDRRPDA
ncbi:MAG: hypothetical protein V1748_06290 [Actinomycetota bacterium]